MNVCSEWLTQLVQYWPPWCLNPILWKFCKYMVPCCHCYWNSFVHIYSRDASLRMWAFYSTGVLSAGTVKSGLMKDPGLRWRGSGGRRTVTPCSWALLGAWACSLPHQGTFSEHRQALLPKTNGCNVVLHGGREDQSAEDRSWELYLPQTPQGTHCSGWDPLSWPCSLVGLLSSLMSRKEYLNNPEIRVSCQVAG